MNKTWLNLTVLGLLLPTLTWAAVPQITVTGTYPANDNAGTCSAPILVPNISSTIKVHFAWSGTAAGEDSISGTKGFSFTWTKPVPIGTYQLRAWPSDAGGVGCDTTLAVTVVLDTKPMLGRLLGKGY